MGSHLALTQDGKSAATSVSLFEQGLIQILQAAVTGLEPKKRYVVALASQPDGTGALEALAEFMTNPAGAAIVNATGPIRQIVQIGTNTERRYLVIAEGTSSEPGAFVQRQTPD